MSQSTVRTMSPPLSENCTGPRESTLSVMTLDIADHAARAERVFDRLGEPSQVPS